MLRSTIPEQGRILMEMTSHGVVQPLSDALQLDSPSLGLDGLGVYVAFDIDCMDLQLRKFFIRVRTAGGSERSGGDSAIDLGIVQQLGWTYLCPRRDTSLEMNDEDTAICHQRYTLAWCQILLPDEII